jgi:hypothetical protein
VPLQADAGRRAEAARERRDAAVLRQVEEAGLQEEEPLPPLPLINPSET